ncbi:MAG: hypothetical protein ABEL51_14565 [Salinibacter sp.]
MPTTVDPDRERLQDWLRRNDFSLAEKAASDIDGTDALHDAARYKEVGPTQIRALLNTAQMCEVHELTDYVRERKERRRKSGQDEAADFWEAVNECLGGLEDEFVEEAAEGSGAPEVTSASLRDGTFDKRTVRTLVTRAYVRHFVAHCQFVQGKSMS